MTSAIFTFAGGIGLFLLGMRLMTDGLKVAAGNTLRNILTAATRDPWRGIASGLLITTAVQSSSAVIFATIGFVNAGLLTLYQAIGIVYGSNLGTTLTSWIVALLGFNVDLRAMALPAIGIGMGLWVMGGSSGRGALGQAIAGFGLFFLGIDILRDSFDSLGQAVSLERWAEHGLLSLLIFMVFGVLLTVLMQSSSAALAVTLTAAAGGLVPASAAAAMIIGANVGTTSTAVFAALGATSPAKRVASAHVIFNLITAVAAFTLLPALLWLARGLHGLVAGEPHVAVSLAIFHTLTKLLGIAIMYPATGWLVRRLEHRFRSAEEDEARPKHLDQNVLATPSLAMDALSLELQRMSHNARGLAAEVLSSESPSVTRLQRSTDALETLQTAVGEFVAGIQRSHGSSELASVLPHALRVAQYEVNVAELAEEMIPLQALARLPEGEEAAQLAHLRAEAMALLAQARVDGPSINNTELEVLRQQFEYDYQGFKARILRAGTAGLMTPRQLAAVLEHSSLLHRLCDQAVKAALYFDRFCNERSAPDGREPPPGDGDEATRSEPSRNDTLRSETSRNDTAA